MKVRRLGWAGLELESQGQTAVIDLVESWPALEAFVGPPLTEMPPPNAGRGTVSLALVTHLHGDHADPEALARALAPDGVVLRPVPAVGEPLEVGALIPAEQGFEAAPFSPRAVDPWESVTVGPFTATAVPAVDGFGDPQISWVVEADGVRIFHGGDTIFHGSWWLISMRCGPVDVAFVPVNGAVCQFPHRQPGSPLPGSMTPADAAGAASLLKARLAVPIHYDGIHKPPMYDAIPDAAAKFEAVSNDVPVRVMEIGEELEVNAAVRA